jgi:hypothetical protein
MGQGVVDAPSVGVIECVEEIADKFVSHASSPRRWCSRVRRRR